MSSGGNGRQYAKANAPDAVFRALNQARPPRRRPRAEPKPSLVASLMAAVGQAWRDREELQRVLRQQVLRIWALVESNP